ncbi:MAG: V-type ATP synthase subunit D [Acidobacteria bacterium]|nr:V-type ATP synthase subunit D [Acidobacteriota bacterium]
MTLRRCSEAGKILGPWAQALGGIAQITSELEKTHRRVNALKHILIPQYRVAIDRIRSVLEEQDRESFLGAKRFKVTAKQSRSAERVNAFGEGKQEPQACDLRGNYHRHLGKLARDQASHADRSIVTTPVRGRPQGPAPDLLIALPDSE